MNKVGDKQRFLVKQRFTISGPQVRLGQYLAFLSLVDGDYDSGGMYCSLLESTNVRMMQRVSLSSIPENTSERILKRLHASRKSEMRYEDKKDRTRALRLRRHVETLESLLRSISENGRRVYGTDVQIVLESDHPIELSRSARRVIGSLEYLGLTMKIKRRITRNEIASSLGPFSDANGRYLMDSMSVASILPIHFEPVPESGGVAIGVDDLTEKPVFINIFGGNSFNVLSFGETGSGKSFFTKLMVRRAILTSAVNNVYIIDPLGEYDAGIFPGGGAVVNVGSGEYVDPLRISSNNPETVDAFISMLIHFDKGIADDVRVLRHYLSEYLHAEGLKTMHGFLQLLTNDKVIPSSVKLISELLSSVFMHEVVIQERQVIIFRPGQLVSSSNEPSMISILLSILSMITSTHGKKVVLVDEAHNLIDSAECSKLLDTLTRHSRHYGTAIISMTQNPEDFFMNPRSHSLLLNSSRIFGFRTKSPNSEGFSIPGYDGFLGVNFAPLLGGRSDPYSECFFSYENHLRKVRILCTEREKSIIDARNA